MRVLGSLLALLLCSDLCSQHDPQLQPVEIQVVRDEDGTPMPGVPVHIAPRQRHPNRCAPPVDGWWPAVGGGKEPAGSRRPVFSDPDGIAILQLQDGRISGHHITAGAPFLSEPLLRRGARWQLRVKRYEQFRVQVVDCKGQNLSHFPIALHAGGSDLAVAWTDARGLAIFAMRPEFEARLTVAPAGWMGPYDGMPTVAKNLRRQSITFQVPPFGYVRARPILKHKPLETVITYGRLDLPTTRVARTDYKTKAHGIEFGPMALGQRLGGGLSVAEGYGKIIGFGPTEHGQRRVVDVAVTPLPKPVAAAAPRVSKRTPRPASGRMQLRFPGLDEAIGKHLRIQILPEGGWPQFAHLPAAIRNRPTGNIFIYSQRVTDDALQGITANVPAGVLDVHIVLNGAPIYHVGRVEVPADGTSTEDRLLAIELADRIETMHVRVVDQQGIPVYRAHLQVHGSDTYTGNYLTDAEGRTNLFVRRENRPRISVQAQGMRTRNLDELKHGDTVVMRPPHTLRVDVRGLPKDLSRERLAIRVAPENRFSKVRAVHAALAEGDVAHVPLPADETYVVSLIVRKRAIKDHWRGAEMAQHDQPVVADDAEPKAIELTIDDQQASAIRTALIKELRAVLPPGVRLGR